MFVLAGPIVERHGVIMVQSLKKWEKKRAGSKNDRGCSTLELSALYHTG